MGCSSCSTNTGDISPGCKNNGTCGTSGCNKLNVYDWLSDMELPEGQKPFNVVEVRFKGSRKEFFRNAEYLPLKTGDVVAVEGTPGHDIGTVSLVGELVRFQLKLNSVEENSPLIKSLYRLARPADIEKWDEVKALEVETMYRARSIALNLNLRMKLSDVEYQGDGKKATFFYTADERVDFRELIKRLADQFKVRVEMRQIGMRQEASRLGGIGSCGRELCCSTWLTDFKIVSTSAARYQNLSLNPLKLAGQCGKLKCCLNYELDSYMDAIKDIPDSNTRLETQKGVAFHRKTDIFKRVMWYAYQTEPGEGASSADSWIALPVDRVKEIIQLNKQGQKPAEMSDYVEAAAYEKPLDYADVVGQDSLNRMLDKKKKKKKKKKKGDGQADSGLQQRKEVQGGQDNQKSQEGQRSQGSPRGPGNQGGQRGPGNQGGQRGTGNQGGQRGTGNQGGSGNQGGQRNQGGSQDSRGGQPPRQRREPQPDQPTQNSNLPPRTSVEPNQTAPQPKPSAPVPSSEKKEESPPVRVRQIPPRINPNEQK